MQSFVASGAAVMGVLVASANAMGEPRARPYERFLYVTAHAKDPNELDVIWTRAEHVLEPHAPRVGAHTLVVTPETLASLRNAGIDLAIEPVDVQRMVDESYAANDAPHAHAAPSAFGTWFDKVQELSAIESYLADLAASSPGRAKVVSIGKSIEGRDIHALLVSSNPDDASRASIVTTGTHHAREWLSPMVAMGIADGLVRQYDADARVKHVVDELNVYVVPVLNPDGYVQTFAGNRLQRRNMHPGCNVDLNRNYPTGFGQKVSNSCTSDTNSGPMPFSEPETQAIRQLAEAQKKLRFYVDYHSNANQVMIPYAYTQTEPPDYAKNKAWGELLGAQAMVPARPGYAVAQGQGGGALDWFREVYTESLVVELPGNGFDPPSNGVGANVELEWNGWIAVADIVATENPAAGGPVTMDAGPVGSGGGTDAGAVADASATGGAGGASGRDASAGVDAGRAGGFAGSGGAGGTAGDDGHHGPSGDKPAGDFAAGCSCRAAGAPRPAWGPFALVFGWSCSRRLRGRRRSRDPFRG